MKKSELQSLIIDPNISQKDKILTLLYASNKALTTTEIRAAGIDNGLRDIKTWNVSDILNKLKNNAIKTKAGWEISLKGKSYFESTILKSTTFKIAEKGLRDSLANIKRKQTSNFVMESIIALENKLLRSAVVLSWVGAMSILYDHTFSSNLVAFNAELSRRSVKNSPIKNIDDFSLIKEYDFLQIITAISVIDKNTKQELETCLKLRNSCGHPNSLQIGESRVASHIEILILNIYSRF